MKTFSLSTLTLIKLSALTSLVEATTYFLDFDACATPILHQYASESCNVANEISRLTCLCSDTIFWTNAAESVEALCGEASLELTGRNLVYNCNALGVAACMTEAEFVAAGGDSSPTPTSGSSGSNSYATPSSYSPQSSNYDSTSPHSSSGSSSGSGGSGYHYTYTNRRRRPIGAIVGGVVGGVAAIGGAIGGWIVYLKKKKAGQGQLSQENVTQISEVPKNDQRAV